MPPTPVCADLPASHHFTFPLNVYARLLELEEGRADYLHYGLFDAPGMTAGTAQRQATELLWQHLPPPCKLLDVGLGLGTTLKRLVDTGYEVTGITPDAAQIAFAQARHGPELPARCCRFEELRDDAGRWQVILFQESGQYIDEIDLFEQAAHLLTEDGEIIVMDEFTRLRDRDEPEHLHHLDYFLRLAQRFGFECQLQIELTAQAAPTVDWLLERCGQHAAHLMQTLAVTQAQLDALDASNRAYREKYASGRYGYFLLRLRRVTRPRWLPGRITAQHSPAMRALFAAVFGHEMSAAHWQWKYGEGRGVGIGIWQPATDGTAQLVAHYGGLVRDIRYFGQPAQALQCGDVMVAPGARGTLSRQGPVFLAAATCLEHDIGYGTPQLIGFGFPNRRAYRLPERLGLYADVGRMVAVTWSALTTRPALWLAVRELQPGQPTTDALIDECWQTMAADTTDYIIGVRDAAHVRHRYLNHPDKTYRFFTVRRRLGGAVLGVLVLRLGAHTANQPPVCELIDMIGAAHHLPLLIHHARRIAAQWQCPMLSAWMTENMRTTLALPEAANIQDLEITLPANAWTPGPAIDAQRGHWWLMGGDTDFL
jgi:cyclopropane fatty-acyl-phospholipid synthase-like methyltransferase